MSCSRSSLGKTSTPARLHRFTTARGTPSASAFTARAATSGESSLASGWPRNRAPQPSARWLKDRSPKSAKTKRIDAVVASLASVQDHELVGEVRSSRATALLETILETHVDASQRARTSRRRLQVIALAAALALAVVLSTAALGVVEDVASFFAGWRDPEAPVPTAPDVVIASGVAGVPWTIVATRSDQGLCLGLAYPAGDEQAVQGGCGYSDIRGDLPPDVRGDPATKCLVTPTKLVPCGSLPLHWIGPFGAGGGSSVLDRTFAFGPLAAEVASVELILTNGATVHAHIVERPEGLGAPLNFYWATWACGSSHCGDAGGPEVRMAVARDSAGRVLERRVPVWNGNPTGDPDGPPAPTPTLP